MAICLLLAGYAASAAALPWRDSRGELEQRAWQEWTDDDEEELERLLAESADLQEAIERDPSDLSLYMRLNEVLFELGLYDEASVVDALAAAADDPESSYSYFRLCEELETCGYYEEALAAHLHALALDAREDDADAEALEALKLLRLAEEKYASCAYAEAAELYGMLADEEYLPVAVTMHYIHALTWLSRPEEALEVLFADYGEISLWFVKDLLLGDVYYHMGDKRSAEFYYQQLYDESDFFPHYRAAAAQRLQALAEYAPPGFEKAFDHPRWAGYSKAAIGFFNELEQPGEIFAVMAKDGHNVLCLLHAANEAEGYAVVWENDAALYQGDRTPRIFVDWHFEGMLEYTYFAEAPEEDGPGSETFLFLCNEETLEWEFARMQRSYWNAADEHSEIISLCMEAEEGRLAMLWRGYEPNGSYLGESEILADMPYDPNAYALKNFHIDRCNADYSALAEECE